MDKEKVYLTRNDPLIANYPVSGLDIAHVASIAVENYLDSHGITKPGKEKDTFEKEIFLDCVEVVLTQMRDGVLKNKKILPPTFTTH